MTQVAVDILVIIRYDLLKSASTCIYTNARTDNNALEDILSTWVQGQLGRGEDPSPAVERDVYTIKLGLVIEDDSFCTEADTGNKGLTCGIVVDVLQNLKSTPVKNLSERPV